jgi:amino acid transporter
MQGSSDRKSIGLLSAVSIGVGGMVGGGIFAVLGLSVQLAQGGAPLAFVLGGVVTSLTAYSYSKLSVAFPSRGGTVAFLDRAFSPGVLIGSLNVLLWLSYIIMLSLYSYAFGSYAASFFPDLGAGIVKHASISIVIILITVLNFLNADMIGKAESLIVAVKVAILVLFIGISIQGLRLSSISPAEWSSPIHVVAGGMIIFLAYEGFELIANTADDVRKPGKTLPRAYFWSVTVVIILYVLISAVTVSNVSVDRIISSRDYALAEAARPFLGQFGFHLIAVAAILSTSSAINATLYGAGRLSYTIARDGELPEILEKQIWHRPLEGLLITSFLTLIIANFLDLSSISTTGSSGFLIIFAAVNLANYKLWKHTGSVRWVPLLGFLACLGALASIVWQTVLVDPLRLAAMGAIIVVAISTEAAYRILKGRKIRLSDVK